MGEVCACTSGKHGFTQHPDFPETYVTASGKLAYVFEFFVCGACHKPTSAYLAKKMESVE